MRFIGFIAAIMTSIAFLPQVIKTWKLKETRDISLLMFLILSAGIFLWIIYGIIIQDIPIIIANSITFILCMIILFLKLKYK
jgi:MtN3 and saliva related transmembrane protein